MALRRVNKNLLLLYTTITMIILLLLVLLLLLLLYTTITVSITTSIPSQATILIDLAFSQLRLLLGA